MINSICIIFYILHHICWISVLSIACLKYSVNRITHVMSIESHWYLLPMFTMSLQSILHHISWISPYLLHTYKIWFTLYLTLYPLNLTEINCLCLTLSLQHILLYSLNLIVHHWVYSVYYIIFIESHWYILPMFNTGFIAYLTLCLFSCSSLAFSNSDFMAARARAWLSSSCRCSLSSSVRCRDACCDTRSFSSCTSWYRRRLCCW